MTQTTPYSPTKLFWLRIPLMGMAIAALIAGLWAGLLRIGWQIPPLSARLLIEHGPLMVAGFLGTLISLERAVALSHLQQGHRIYYMVPLRAGVGTFALFLPLPVLVSRFLLALAALGFVILFIMIYRLQPSTHNAVMSLGALLWLVGNILWLAGLPVARVVPWWAGFLVLTIAGERLELARVLVLSPAVRGVFFAIIGIVLASLLVAMVFNDLGLRLVGLGWFALGLWLLRFDIARRTIHQQGLTRYIAACLLSGYLWLVVGGVLWMVYGSRYAMLHTIFLGFVFSMIFGHAPVIIPAVMGVPVKYLPIFYLHLGLLHTSLVLRVAGDLLFWQSTRRWGGLLNEVAVILFLVFTVIAARRGIQEQV